MIDKPIAIYNPLRNSNKTLMLQVPKKKKKKNRKRKEKDGKTLKFLQTPSRKLKNIKSVPISVKSSFNFY